jgi:hypothetical protein
VRMGNSGDFCPAGTRKDREILGAQGPRLGECWSPPQASNPTEVDRDVVGQATLARIGGMWSAPKVPLRDGKMTLGSTSEDPTTLTRCDGTSSSPHDGQNETERPMRSTSISKTVERRAIRSDPCGNAAR